MLFFHSSSPKENKQLVSSNVDQNRFLDHNNGDGNELAIICHDNSSVTTVDESHSIGDHHSVGSHDTDNNGGSEDEGRNIDGVVYYLVVPGVLLGDDVSDIEVRLVGFGKIAACFFSKDGVFNGLCRIWCEWFGNDQNIVHCYYFCLQFYFR